MTSDPQAGVAPAPPISPVRRDMYNDLLREITRERAEYDLSGLDEAVDLLRMMVCQEIKHPWHLVYAAKAMVGQK